MLDMKTALLGGGLLALAVYHLRRREVLRASPALSAPGKPAVVAPVAVAGLLVTGETVGVATGQDWRRIPQREADSDSISRRTLGGASDDLRRERETDYV